MKKFTARFDKNTVRVYEGQTLFGSIDFSKERMAHADIYVYADRFHIGPATDTGKDIVLTKADIPVLSFAFDKLWGETGLTPGASGAGIDIIGHRLKPGTRLVDKEDKGLVVISLAKPSDNEIEISANEGLDPVLLLSTLYYHLYASRSKALSAVLGNGFRGAVAV